MRATHLIFWSPISGLLMAVLTACGGDSGSGSDTAAQAQQTCTKLCNKENECNPSLKFNCDDFCNPKSGSNPGSSGGGSTSSNCDVNALLKKENECVSGSCADLASCLAD